MSSAGFDGFIDDITRWRKAVPTRAPSYHRILEELVALLGADVPESFALAERFREAWKARTFHIYYERPLLFLAVLRRDALVEGAEHPLFSALVESDPSRVTRAALLETLGRDFIWQTLRARFVQTNETSRAIAWLWPAEIVGCSRGARKLALVEVGAAAGLNLVADRLASRWKTAAGAPLAAAHDVHTVVRLGVDAHPLDVRIDDDANWLRACVWAGEDDRLRRLEAAIAAFRGAPAQVESGDVIAVPNRLRTLSELHDDGRTVVLAFQTIVRDYVDSDTRARYERMMRSWIEDAPFAGAIWVELELDHAEPDRGVPLVAHVRDVNGVVDLVLARTGYHPSKVQVEDAAVEQLRELMRVS